MLDAVLIASPNSTHLEHCEAALERQIHVLCEKPALLTEHEAKQVLALATKSQAIFREAFMYRFHPQYQLTHTLLPEICGTLEHISVEFTYILEDKHNIRALRECAGGALNDVGCYAIDLANWFSGETGSSFVADCHAAADCPIDQRTWFSAHYKNGLTMTALVAMDLPRKNLVTFRGKNGTLTLTSAFRPANVRGPLITTEDCQGRQKTIHAPGGNQYTLMLERFANEVAQAKRKETVGVDSAWPRWSNPLANAAALERLQKLLTAVQSDRRRIF